MEASSWPLWSMDQSFICPSHCDDDMLRCRGVLVLDKSAVSSVSTAVEQLNSGALLCPNGLCSVYSASQGSLFILYRHGMDKQSLVEVFTQPIGQPVSPTRAREVGPQSAEAIADEDAAVRRALRGEGTAEERAGNLRAGCMQRTLRRAQRAVEVLHKEVTATWREPLSLFDSFAGEAAVERGVPQWAAQVVQLAVKMVDTAVGVDDLRHRYEMQIDAAVRDSRKIDRTPIVNLLERCDRLAEHIRELVPLLVEAREAFDKPEDASLDGPVNEHGCELAPLLEALFESSRAEFSALGVPASPDTREFILESDHQPWLQRMSMSAGQLAMYAFSSSVEIVGDVVSRRVVSAPLPSTGGADGGGAAGGGVSSGGCADPSLFPGLAAAQSAAVFLVEDGQPRTAQILVKDSVAVRRSKNLEDRIGYHEVVEFGSLVVGVPEGDWLKVGEGRYLPMCLKDRPILVPRDQIEQQLAQQSKLEAEAASRLAKKLQEKNEAAEELARFKAELASAQDARRRQKFTAFLVDGSQLKAESDSVGFRRSKDLNDRAGNGLAAKFGSLVVGEIEGDWLKVSEERYLPMALDGKTILVHSDQLEQRLAQQSRSNAEEVILFNAEEVQKKNRNVDVSLACCLPPFSPAPRRCEEGGEEAASGR